MAEEDAEKNKKGPDGIPSETRKKTKKKKTNKLSEEAQKKKVEEMRSWRQQMKDNRKQTKLVKRVEGNKRHREVTVNEDATPAKVKAKKAPEPITEDDPPKKKLRTEHGEVEAVAPEAFKIVVAGLKPGIVVDAAEGQLRSHFENCGEIMNIRVLKDRNTGQSRGIAFVTFNKKKSMKAAIEMNGELLLGRSLLVEKSTDKDAGAAAKGGGKGKAPAVPGAKPDGCTSVIVKGLAYSVTDAELKHFFKDCGDGPTNVSILADKDTGASRGMAFVDFDDEDAVDQAILLHNSELKGRCFQMDYAAPREKGKGPGHKPADCTSVLVKGLAYSVTDKDLQKVFKQCGGGPTNVRMVNDKSGSFRGMAFVDFANENDLDAAIKLHGSELQGRRFIMDYASSDGKSKADGEKHNEAPKGQKPPGCTSVTLNNLAQSVTEKKLLKLFADCGEGPRSVNLVKEKSMAFVNFKNEDGVKQAMELDGSELKGQVIEMGFVKPKSKKKEKS